MSSENVSDRDICVVKVGKPDVERGMETCGKECEYLTSERDGVFYSGWYHVDRLAADHHAVPKRMIG